MKKYTTIVWIALLLAVLSACGVQTPPTNENDVPPAADVSRDTADGQAEEKVVYVPMWMQNNSVVYYDAEMNRTIEAGGDLTDEEVSSRPDIDPATMYNTLLAEPNTKVEYDLHGSLQNVYYLGGDGKYYLDPQTAANQTR